MNRRAFERLNLERDQEGQPRFANPRNAAAGSIRVLEPAITASRRLDYYAYFLLADGAPYYDSHWESLERSGRAGLQGEPATAACAQDIEELLEFCREWEPAARGASL